MSEVLEAVKKQHVAFAQFKRANDERILQLEKRGNVDPVLEEKVEKANYDLTNLIREVEHLGAKMNRPGRSGNSFSDSSVSLKAMELFMRSGDVTEMKSLSVGTDADGGYAIPKELDNTLTNHLFDSSVMRQISTVKQIGSAKYSKAVSTGGLVAGWVGETGARPETGTPTIAEIVPPTGELYANPAATQWMIEDNTFGLANWLINEIQGTFASMEGSAFITGDGSNKPKGVLDYTSVTTDDDTRAFGSLKHTVTAAATAITGDEIINLSYDLRGVYRPNAVWVMNSKTAAYIRKLKDANGLYIWQPSFQTGQPAQLSGYPCLIDESMPDIATGNVAVMFGNFKVGYEILDRSTNMIRDPYTNKPFTLFYTTKRVSGMLVDSNSIRLLMQA